MRRKHVIALLLAAFCALTTLTGIAQDDTRPFGVSARLSRDWAGDVILTVSLTMADGHFLYSDRVSVTPPEGLKLVEKSVPEPESKMDPVLEHVVKAYKKDVDLVYDVKNLGKATEFTVTVGFQGCNDQLCFMPETYELIASFDTEAAMEPVPETPPEVAVASDELRVTGKAAGYLGVEDFLDFMDRVESGETGEKDALQRTLENGGPMLLVLAILLGGLALNLTPCVLPMIPINIAIIGAGTQALRETEGGSVSRARWRGFLLGGSYGAGIAVVYGALGLLVIRAGSRFGSLNASPWFNAVIAAIFVLLSLGMFGVLVIDFSRFQSMLGRPSSSKKGTFLGAFAIGGIAALLAGACVAPVVISVLLLATDLTEAGHAAGQALPFLLGIGMGLPWPFVGAGFSFLPRPGKWMDHVKHGFGVVMLGFAAWYGYQSYVLAMDASTPSMAEVTRAQEAHVHEGWHTSLEDAIAEARQANKPVFVDFWASWCKNCLKMEKTTFKSAEVLYRLESYVKVKYQAQDMKDPAIKADLDRFGVMGLPTYVILRVPDDSL